MPATTNNESPGKKKPANKPVSAKMINTSKYNPPISMYQIGFKTVSLMVCHMPE
jgi:hypothetical protein